MAALQDLIQKTIDRAEPSIACILVSRSDEYKRFETVPADEGSGKLGRFDGSRLTRSFFPDDMSKEARERAASPRPSTSAEPTPSRSRSAAAWSSTPTTAWC